MRRSWGRRCRMSDYTPPDYSLFKNPHPQADRPVTRPNRGMNTALHGAGSRVGTRRQAEPLERPRECLATNSAEKPPSDRSVAWLRDILVKRQLPDRRVGNSAVTGDEQARRALQLLDVGHMTQAQVSAAIDAFKDCPRKDAASPVPASNLQRVIAYLRERRDAGTLNEFGASLLEQYERRGTLSDRQVEVCLRGIPSNPTEGPEEVSPVESVDRTLPPVPAGRYAVESEAGELTFYRVKRARKGPHTWIFLKHGPTESEVPFSWKGYRTILQSIVDADPFEAALRYGRELKCCSVCALDLTNRLSRELGIGPVCGGRYFEEPGEWVRVKKAARESIRARGEDPEENV